MGWLRTAFNRLNYRRLFVAVGVVVHLGVVLLMEVGPFSWIMLAFYPCLYGAAEWQAAWRRLWKRGEGQPQQAAPEEAQPVFRSHSAPCEG